MYQKRLLATDTAIGGTGKGKNGIAIVSNSQESAV
jgi:hypothetical protein